MSTDDLANYRVTPGDDMTPERNTMNHIIWTCDVCGRTITAGTGYIELDTRKVHAYEQDVKAWREKHTPSGWEPIGGDVLLTFPEAPRWAVFHGKCDPDPEHSGYWFAVERADTAAKVLDWTLHLAEKPYVENSNWTSFIRERVLPQLTRDRGQARRDGRTTP